MPDLPPNEEFSVVSGRVRTADGRERDVEVIVPTVVGPGGSLAELVTGPLPAGPARGAASEPEMAEGALLMLRDDHPGCEWVDWPACREATAAEAARALEDGVNERFARVMGLTPAPREAGTPRRGLLGRLFGR